MLFSRRELLQIGGMAVVAGGTGAWSSLFESKGAKISQRVAAGGPTDFMVVRHVRVEGSNREIGKAIGELARKNHGVQLSTLEKSRQAARLEHRRKAYPEMYERALGVAEAYGVKEGGADLVSLDYNGIDRPGCSTVYYPPSATENKHAIISRNYDFTTATLAEMMGMPAERSSRPFTGDPYVLEILPDKGLASLYICSYDLLSACVDGVNSAGVGVALLADDVSDGAQPTRGSRAGLNEIELPRYVLDRCNSADHAQELLAELDTYYTFLPCHYIVGDRSGDSFVWERTIPDGKRHVVSGGGKPQVVTNHLVSQFAKPDEHKEPYPAGSFNRYCKLRDGIAAKSDKLSLEEIRALNVGVQAGPTAAMKGRNIGRTLWHSIYDLHENSLEVSFYLGEDESSSSGQKRTDYLKFKL
jgi:hypothetical protein